MTHRTHHLAALAGTAISAIGALTPSDWAHLAAAFSGLAAGTYYAVQAATAAHRLILRLRRRHRATK
ncbi:hypothetical protein OPIT5_16730 [Opitutaceae bacterium TAV5]|nr:hypothetical protein OPIT5_16730 [Opitutaceae bacterium TAV5]